MTGRPVGLKSWRWHLKRFLVCIFFSYVHLGIDIFYHNPHEEEKIKEIHFRKRYCCAFETSTFHEVLV